MVYIMHFTQYMRLPPFLGKGGLTWRSIRWTTNLLLEEESVKEPQMSLADYPEHECWEYRHQCFDPDRNPSQNSSSGEQDPEFIAWLIETLEGIDHSEEGWRLVSAKIEADEDGFPRLDVLMKRPLADSQNPRGGSSIPHAA
jgi:hypothetical protein